MRNFILVFLLSGLVFTSNAQSKSNSRDGGLFNFGVGLSNRGVPIYGGLEFFASPNFTIGGTVGFQSYVDHYRGYRYAFSIVTVSAVGNYHFNNLLNIPEPWDFYAGLNLGFAVTNYSSPDGSPDYDGSVNSGLALGLQVGGRYYFNNRRWGLNLEVGGGNIISSVRLGLTYNF